MLHLSFCFFLNLFHLPSLYIIYVCIYIDLYIYMYIYCRYLLCIYIFLSNFISIYYGLHI